MKLDKLVIMHSDNEARVATNLLYKGFGYKDHRSFKKIIWNNLYRFKEIGEVLQSSTVDGSRLKKMGQPDKSYLLNSRQFTLLIMLAKNSPESIELKCRVEKEFEKMRNMLIRAIRKENKSIMIEWAQARTETKESTKEKNAVVQKFIEYAIKQGSTHATHYYSNIAKMENGALFLLEDRKKDIRDLLNSRQLGRIKECDYMIEDIMTEEMKKDTHYKRIYELCSDKVKLFASVVGKTQLALFKEQMNLKKLDTLPKP